MNSITKIIKKVIKISTGQVITFLGKKIAINRIFLASPTYTAPSQFKVGTYTDTPTINDTNLGIPVVIAGGLYVKNFVSGYPTIDEPSLNATIRSLLLTTDANGNSLTEYGEFNTDGTPKCFSRAVYTSITKNTSTQVIFVSKLKVS